VDVRNGQFAEAAAQFRPALADCDPRDDTDLRANLGIAAFHLGDDHVVQDHHTRLLTDARESGALLMIVHALTRRACGDVAAGDWDALAAGAAEALDLAGSSGQPSLTRFPHGWLAVLAALRDQRDQLAGHLQAIAALPSAGVTGPLVDDLARWARALTAETPTATLHHLEQMTTPMTRLAALDRIEAAVRAQCADLARDWSAELDQFGVAVESGWARAAAAYGRALLSDDTHAPEQFEQAIQHAGTAARRFDRARIHLGYGEHLRRPPPGRCPRPSAHRARSVRRPRGHAVGHARRARAARLRRDRPPPRRHHRDPAHRPGTAGRHTRSAGPVQPGRRRTVVPQPSYCRLPPAQRVQQARPELPRRTRRPPAHLSARGGRGR
jgi:hypothetical protein